MRRNGYGRQLDSFEADLDVEGLDEPFHAVFIRAPVVERVGPDVEILARHDGVPVLVRQRSCTVASFHPELTDDGRLHAMFVDMRSDSPKPKELPCPAIPNGQPSSTRRAPPTQARGKLFAKLARQIEVAAKGGGDVDMNPTLRTAVQKAKAAPDDQRRDRPGDQARHGRGGDGGQLRERSCTRATRPAVSRC